VLSFTGILVHHSLGSTSFQVRIKIAGQLGTISSQTQISLKKSRNYSHTSWHIIIICRIYIYYIYTYVFIISSYIIIYHHISSYIITYHHISSYIIIYHHHIYISSYSIIFHHISSYIIYYILSYIIIYQISYIKYNISCIYII
jgi:hypothetical protein